MSGNSPAVVNYWSTKGRGVVAEWMDASRVTWIHKDTWICNVGLMSPQPFKMPWNECYIVPSSVCGPLWRSLDPCHLYSTQNSSVTELFLNQVYLLNWLSKVHKDWGKKNATDITITWMLELKCSDKGKEKGEMGWKWRLVYYRLATKVMVTTFLSSHSYSVQSKAPVWSLDRFFSLWRADVIRA